MVGQYGHLASAENTIRARLVNHHGHRVFFAFTYDADVYTALYPCVTDAPEKEMDALLERLRHITPHIAERSGWSD